MVDLAYQYVCDRQSPNHELAFAAAPYTRRLVR